MLEIELYYSLILLIYLILMPEPQVISEDTCQRPQFTATFSCRRLPTPTGGSPKEDTGRKQGEDRKTVSKNKNRLDNNNKRKQLFEFVSFG
jgi:hypothetical protein